MTDVVQPVKVLDRKKLRRQRFIAGLTQAGLAEKAGCSEVHVWYLENGKRDASAPMLASLARGLECQTADLMADEPAGRVA
jgi:transcriptional regulator with XRE-family HTH domain